MFFKNLCVLVLLMKVVSALERLKSGYDLLVVRIFCLGLALSVSMECP